MRVTQTKRKCPHCGFLVTPEEIDRQNSALGFGGWGCLIILVVAIINAIIFWVASTPGILNALVGLLILIVLILVASLAIRFIQVDVRKRRKLNS